MLSALCALCGRQKNEQCPRQGTLFTFPFFTSTPLGAAPFYFFLFPFFLLLRQPLTINNTHPLKYPSRISLFSVFPAALRGKSSKRKTSRTDW